MVMHTHFYGRVVSAWRVRRNIAGKDDWTLLGKRHPLAEAQSFYPIATAVSNNETTGIPSQNINRNLEGEQTTLLYGDTISFR